jgi:peptidoglycan hydrolase-like protein with peptidoglycan-binding domain
MAVGRYGSIEYVEGRMKILRYGIAVGLIAGLGACSNFDSRGSVPQSTAMAPSPAVAPDMVRQVQSKLRDGGYYGQGPVDGVWGSGTQASVRSFQHDHNLATNGQLDVPTLQALNLTSSWTPDTASNAPAPTQPNYNPAPPAPPPH